MKEKDFDKLEIFICRGNDALTEAMTILRLEKAEDTGTYELLLGVLKKLNHIWDHIQYEFGPLKD